MAYLKQSRQSKTIAQSRQHLAALILAAQAEPQVITKHDKPVAVVVSPDYFGASLKAEDGNMSFYDRLMKARKQFAPKDNHGLGKNAPSRKVSWQRANSFTVSTE